MSVWAFIDGNGNILNRVVADNSTDCACPQGCSIVADNNYAIGGILVAGIYTPPPSPPLPLAPPFVLSQDLMAQFTTADAAAIQSAVATDAQFWLLWSALQAQKDPMLVTNDRFLQGWSALVSVLGQTRMTAIANALGITVAA